MTTLTGRIINGYLVQEEIGRGGMGVVFKAQQLSVDRAVALKFLSARVADDERVIARFMREAKAAGKLAHPNVVSVYDAGFAEGLHYIAMELVDGSSVRQKIKDNGPLSEDDALSIGAQMAEALRFAHDRGVLHRDVKPDNFLIDRRGHVRLADLGLARFVGNPDITELTQDGTTLGTPQYMSPEQCKGVGVDARSDLYSLGASLYLMVTGKAPFDGGGPGAVIAKVLTEKPPPIREVNPALSPAFVWLVETLMAKDPKSRFANAGEALRGIERCKAERAKMLAAQAAPASPVRLQLKFMILGAIGAVVFLVFLGNAAKRRQQRQEQLENPTATDTGTNRATGTGTATGVESMTPSTTPPASPREVRAKQLFEEAEDAHRRKDRATMNAKLNELSLQYADTEFAKAHARDISELPTK